jgi:hypothetical protein
MSKYIIVKGKAAELELAVTALMNGQLPASVEEKEALVELGIATATESEGSVTYAFAPKFANLTFTVQGGLVRINDSIFIQAMVGATE